MFHAEVVRRDGVPVGYVRAASYGHTLGGAVGLAMVEAGEPVDAVVPRRRRVDRRDRRPRVPGAGVVCAAVRPDQRTHQELTMWRATDGQPMVLPKIAYGRGSRLYDVTGKEYIDGSGGPAVYCLGHAHPEVNDAIKRQLDAVAHAYRYNFASDPMDELTELVARRSGPGLQQDDLHHRRIRGGRVGVEGRPPLPLRGRCADPPAASSPANARGTATRSARCRCRTSRSGARRTRVRSSPASHLSAVNPYRPPAGVAADDVAAACADELEREIVRLGAENVAGFVFEPVVGAAGGAVPAPPGYARMVRDICDRHGVLMIADEVMCGTGRCGTWRALEHDGVTPDVMAVAKGLGGGYVPLGATLYHDKVAAVLDGVGGPHDRATRSPGTRSPARPVSRSSASSSATSSSSECEPTARA